MSGGPDAGVFAVLFVPRAMRELLQAGRGWRANRLEAPRLIDDELDRALKRIAVFPHSAPTVRGRDVRRMGLRRTGYLLFYRVRPPSGASK
jgi:hypothetical protein